MRQLSTIPIASLIFWRVSLAIFLAASLTACHSKAPWTNPSDEAAFHPANLTGGGQRPAPDLLAKPDPNQPLPAGFLLDAMVGQVNGRPIYASTILGPIESQLRALGSNPAVSPRDFGVQAGQLIVARLRGHVSDIQLLSKAQAHLQEGQVRGLDYLVNRRREELLRRYGQGSAALAQAYLYRAEGLTLNEKLKEFREGQLAGFYLHDQVLPLINVTRRDIERWYHDHRDQFIKPDVRKVRIIRLVDSARSGEVVEKLRSGASFESLAKDPTLNAFTPDEGGLLASAIMGEPKLSITALNPLIAEMGKPGEWAGPVRDDQNRVWLVALDSMVAGFNRNLDDVQAEIHSHLMALQRKKLTDQIYVQAAREGSCSEPGPMVEALLQIAATRYSRLRPRTEPPPPQVPSP